MKKRLILSENNVQRVSTYVKIHRKKVNLVKKCKNVKLQNQSERTRYSAETRKTINGKYKAKVSQFLPLYVWYNELRNISDRIIKSSVPIFLRQLIKITQPPTQINRTYHKYKLLTSNDIEQNPGPNTNINTLELENVKNQIIFTYNVQGCKDFKKLKRIMNFFNKQKCSNNCIINLQETHLDNNKTIPYHWKKGNVQSPSKGNSGGVAILYNTSFFDDIIDKYSDNEGRFCSFTAIKNEQTFIYLNIYAPNDHYKSMSFFIALEAWLTEAKNKHPLANLVISGDFNFIFDPTKDAIGRQHKNQEQKLAGHIQRLMTRSQLIDAYRQKHNWGGFTWGRNNPNYMRSRLDHILISDNIKHDLIQAYTTKGPNESDHSLVYIELDTKEIKYGPGIKRCNSDLLNNELIHQEVKTELTNVLKNVPNHWNPHQRLDYMKMHTRNIMIRIGKKKATEQRSALEHSNSELELLNKRLDKLLIEAGNDLNTSPYKKGIEKVKEAIEIVEVENNYLKEELSKKLIFRSRAKWAEEGEKSNKYFLNLLKERQAKMVIRKIISNGRQHTEQDEISKAITTFYRNLYKKNDKILKTDSEEFKKLSEDLPKLSDDDKNFLKKPITKQEIYDSLKTCKESAPGPDGITYDIYKKLWDIFGNLIFEAWEHSVKTGILPTTQRDSVITLLEKKGKDKTKIENLRPISLSNCDIKICTKAIALRTNKVTNSILTNTQTGYIPGKQITDNCRLLEEIINLTNKEDLETYIITLDAQKAFDSVDHNYLTEILKCYGFPLEYITWVKLIYTKLRANIMINGFLGEIIEIQRSVKQGDALSCALFIIAIDPLLRQIEKDKRIIPFDMNRNPKLNPINVKSATFADDITAICKNREGIKHIIENYNSFSQITGINLNIPKTEILILGKEKNTIQNFVISNDNCNYTITNQQSIKVCGITFSADHNISYNENAIKKIDKMTRQLNIWRQRNLTLQGKILIVKTFALSQLIYSMQCTNFKKKELIQIENEIFKFIWNIKQSSSKVTGKIRREILKGPITCGGLNAPDVTSLNSAIKYKFLLRCQTNNHPIAKFIKQNTQEGSKLANEVINITKLDYSEFIKSAIQSHNEIHNNAIKDVRNLIISKTPNLNTYYRSYIGKISIDNGAFINKNQVSLTRKLQRNGIKTYQELWRERTLKNMPSLWYEVMQIFASFPREWITLMNINNANKDLSNMGMIPIKENIFKDPKNITTRDIRISLSTKKNITETDLINKIQGKHNLPLNPRCRNPFKIILETTNEQQLRNVQYKILHNIYPTMNHLYKWKIKQSPNCACGEIETLKHAITDCHYASQSMEEFKKVMKDQANITLDLNEENILFGLNKNDCREFSPYIPAINTCLILLKRNLILQRENKKILTQSVIRRIIASQIAKEKYNAKKHKKTNAFRLRWPDSLIEMIG